MQAQGCWQLRFYKVRERSIRRARATRKSDFCPLVDESILQERRLDEADSKVHDQGEHHDQHHLDKRLE